MKCRCEQFADNKINLAPACFKDFWIFKDLNIKEMEALSASAVRNKVTKGHDMFSQGDPADQMFLIKYGRVKLFKIMSDGTEITLDIRKAGDILGENVFSEEAEYPVNAQCIDDTFTCGFSRNRFESLIISYPKIGLRIIRNLSTRISWLTSQVGNLSLSNIEERLYHVVMNVAKEHGIKTEKGMIIPFLMTHEELSFLIGAHRVSVTRALSSLKKSGKIIFKEKKIIFPFSSSGTIEY